MKTACKLLNLISNKEDFHTRINNKKISLTSAPSVSYVQAKIV